MSTLTSTRQPLLPLSIHHLPPSPLSIPLKRPHSTHSTSSTSTSSLNPNPRKTRKLASAQWDHLPLPSSTLRKVRSNLCNSVTYREKGYLESDDLGVGKSPARRLFVGIGEGSESGKRSSGISGAIITLNAEGSRSSHPTQDAPTSPILQSTSTINDNLPIWDCGFIIHTDETATLPHTQPFFSNITPTSQRTRSAPTLTTLHTIPPPSIPTITPSSPTLSNPSQDQENVPPPMIRSRTSTPKSSTAFTPSTRHSVDNDGGDWVEGSPRRRGVTGKSRLGVDSPLGKGRTGGVEDKAGREDEQGEGEDELTPGRKVGVRSKGKARLTREIDIVR